MSIEVAHPDPTTSYLNTVKYIFSIHFKHNIFISIACDETLFYCMKQFSGITTCSKVFQEWNERNALVKITTESKQQSRVFVQFSLKSNLG